MEKVESKEEEGLDEVELKEVEEEEQEEMELKEVEEEEELVYGKVMQVKVEEVEEVVEG